MAQDMELGYTIPLTIESVRKIPGAEVYPVGWQDQVTINKRGEVIPKKRVTHDFSFNKGECHSIIQCVCDGELPGVIFGHAMPCIIQPIHHLHWNLPNDQILCNKIDVEKVYRGFRTTASIATKCIAIWFLNKMWQDKQYLKSQYY